MASHDWYFINPSKLGPLCYRIASIRMSRLIILIILILVIAPLFTHYYLSKFVGDVQISDDLHKNIQLNDLEVLEAKDLKMRIEELIRIKTSVTSELRELESRRQKLQSEIVLLTQNVEDLKREYSRHHLQLERIQLSLKQAQFAHTELQNQNIPLLLAPRRILPINDLDSYLPPPRPGMYQHCRMHTCFDYSRCSVTSGFPVYFYHPDDYRHSWTHLDNVVKQAVTDALNMNIHITFDPGIACIYVVLVGEVQSQLEPSFIQQYLNSLAHWNGDGRNHLILNLIQHSNASNVFKGVDTGRAIVGQSVFTSSEFRGIFDIVVPPIFEPQHESTWASASLLTPARRKYLLSYIGEYVETLPEVPQPSSSHEFLQNTEPSHNHTISRTFDDQYIIGVLKQLQGSSIEDAFSFQFTCSFGHQSLKHSDWALCEPSAYRLNFLRDSTFSLIISPSYYYISTHQFQTRLYESLKTGSIPVILGDYVQFPFQEFIDWTRACLILPKSRVTELHYILKTYTDADITELRKQGRLLWEKYLSSTQQVVSTMLSLIRSRIHIPASPVQDEASPSVFNATFQPIKVDITAPQEAEPEENLGPTEPPFPSLPFQRNFSIAVNNQKWVWNTQLDPFNSYPYLPDDPVLPSEAKFFGSSFGFRPVGLGAGGSGKEFSEALGGNVPREQFTVVMLTYEREAVLIDSLQRLRGLPHINKVVVVWNSPKPPSADLRWPEIGVPIEVVRAKKNSLNNRFLPYSAIETEAVLSVDDDAHLRHDEIVFGFRVWREARDRIVGFPGRYHAWDAKNHAWLYNSNYSCELSMVLTGAAFFHKYYAYLYSYVMPQAIRDKVDEYMNCEDIAMNFLVSHITRKPPVKVTSRWTFRCPGCPMSLSEEDSHFHERHKCINFFIQVYGYLPLLYTQFRVDSVLFKTRIPHDKQKCFKFI